MKLAMVVTKNKYGFYFISYTASVEFSLPFTVKGQQCTESFLLRSAYPDKECNVFILPMFWPENILAPDVVRV